MISREVQRIMVLIDNYVKQENISLTQVVDEATYIRLNQDGLNYVAQNMVPLAPEVFPPELLKEYSEALSKRNQQSAESLKNDEKFRGLFSTGMMLYLNSKKDITPNTNLSSNS